MRIPLAVNLESRDGGVNKDAKVVNGLVESKGEDVPPDLLKRPGVTDLGQVGSGTAQLLYNWNGLKVIQGDVLYSGTVGTVVSSPHVTGAGTLAVLNSSDKSANITLSGSNLTATNSSATTWAAVRATIGKSSGKWYWEMSGSATHWICGVGDSSASLETWVGNNADSWGVESSTGLKYTNGVSSSFTTAIPAGEVVGFALDMDAGTLQLYRSGVLVGSMATGLTGTIFPMFAVKNTPESVVVIFGSAGFRHPVPSGFSPLQTVATSGLMYDAIETSPGVTRPYLFVKNSRGAFVVDRSGVVTAVSYASTMGAATYGVISITRSGTTATATVASDVFNVGDSVTVAGANESSYNGTVTVTAITSGVPQHDVALSITRSGTTATAVSSVPHGLTNGTTYEISGATESAYNGSYAVTVVDSTTFTYTVTVTPEAPASPAAGSPSISSLVTDGEVQNNNNTPTDYTRFNCTPLELPNTAVDGDSVTINAGAPVGGTFTVQGASSSGFHVTNTGYGFAYQAGSSWNRTPPTISSITRSAGSTNAVITTTAAHKVAVGDKITIVGCNQSQYNVTDVFVSAVTSTTITFPVSIIAEQPTSPATGSPVVTVPAVNATFKYTVSGSPTTPATGTITAQGGGGTVRGVPYIDGYFCVMDTNGVIWNSNSDDPTTWGSLNFLTARNENGAGKALVKALNYLVPFKEFSTEFYYDAQNATGSPFSPVDNGFTRIGCASGDSVGKVGNTICWISQTKEGGRSVHRMDGLQQTEIATPDIQRIVTNDLLTTVYAYGWELKGRELYILTLVGSNLTLVYDLSSQTWTQWTSLTLGSGVSVTSINLSGTTATVVATGHGLNDGDPVKISGADQSDYNGIFQIRKVDANTFTVEVANSPVTPATGTITATGYTESYFKFTHATTYQGSIYLLHETDGHLYQMLPSLYQDAGIPIDVFSRSVRLDGGDDSQKKMSKVRFIGDLVSDIGMVRFSDDDSQSFSKYRIVNLDEQPSEIRKCGGFRRRSIEFRHVGNTPLRAEGLELEISK